ncbi:MAG: hypothetical protein O3B13_21020 [Planctomycetota bacterium]|nr:hypothetical protein [Planctomycetota bacterium]
MFRTAEMTLSSDHPVALIFIGSPIPAALRFPTDVYSVKRVRKSYEQRGHFRHGVNPTSCTLIGDK